MDSPSPKTVVKRLWNPAGVEQSKTRKTRSICEKTDPTIFFFWVLRLSQSTSSGRFPTKAGLLEARVASTSLGSFGTKAGPLKAGMSTNIIF